MKILVLGDVMGPSGRIALKKNLPNLIKSEELNFVIINGENSADECSNGILGRLIFGGDGERESCECAYHYKDGLVRVRLDGHDMSRAPSSCGCINWAVAASCVAPRSEVRGTAQAPSGDKLGLRRSGKEFVRRRSGSGAGRRGPGSVVGSPVTTA